MDGEWFNEGMLFLYNKTSVILIGLILGLLTGGYAEEKEFEHTKRLAKDRYSSVLLKFGVMYYKGEGVPQDYKEAAKRFSKSAEQGEDMGQYYFGIIYANGEGVPQDYKEAVKWFSKSAEQGDDKAQYNLGMFYYLGQGVIEDYINAYAWISVAKANGYTKAVKQLDLIRETMSKDQIAEGQKLAREIYNRIEANRKD